MSKWHDRFPWSDALITVVIVATLGFMMMGNYNCSCGWASCSLEKANEQRN